MYIVFFIASILNIFPDTNCCNSHFVLKNKQENVYMYTDNKGMYLIDTIINDTILEDYFTGRIYYIENEYAYIEGNYVFDSIKHKGWVLTENLGIYTLLSSKVPLYKDPNLSSSVSYIVNPEWYPLKIIKCKREWLYVIYEDKIQKVAGWLFIDYQCPNSYSPCN